MITRERHTAGAVPSLAVGSYHLKVMVVSGLKSIVKLVAGCGTGTGGTAIKPLPSTMKLSKRTTSDGLAVNVDCASPICIATPARLASTADAPRVHGSVRSEA